MTETQTVETAELTAMGMLRRARVIAEKLTALGINPHNIAVSNGYLWGTAGSPSVANLVSVGLDAGDFLTVVRKLKLSRETVDPDADPQSVNAYASGYFDDVPVQAYCGLWRVMEAERA